MKVAIIMGSTSDLSVMKEAKAALKEFGLAAHVEVVSAHRTPDAMLSFARSAAEHGFHLIIAGAGGAAHLPGMVASLTTLPVIGVPIQIGKLKGLDALLSILQMPKGIPVATVAVDNAWNAGILAVRILAIQDPTLQKKLLKYEKKLAGKVKAMNQELKKKKAL